MDKTTFFENLKKNRPFKAESSRFCMMLGLKCLAVPAISLIFISYMLANFMNIIYLFFRSQGYIEVDALKEAYFDFIFQGILYLGPYLAGLTVFIFFAGQQLGVLLLRPVTTFAKNCQKLMEESPDDEQKIISAPNRLEKLSLLHRIGDDFYNYSYDLMQMKNETPAPAVLDKDLRKIKGPIIDKTFFIQYFCFLIFVSIVSILVLYMVTVDIHENIVNLAISSMKNNSKSLTYFLYNQNQTLTSIHAVSSILILFFYTRLGLQSCQQFNGIYYSIFRTLRIFMSGDFRVRARVRFNDPVQCEVKKINEYLEFLESGVSHHISNEFAPQSENKTQIIDPSISINEMENEMEETLEESLMSTRTFQIKLLKENDLLFGDENIDANDDLPPPFNPDKLAS